MKVIIVGCGKVGSTIARSLVSENHDVILVDKSQSLVDAVSSDIDCMAVVGNGAIQSVLIEAQIETADFLIACTNSDEINILTCFLARKTSKCRTVARIRNLEYAKQIEYIMKELDISLTINPELETAREIARILRYPKSISSDTFFNGRFNSLMISIPDDSKIIGMKLKDANILLHSNVLVCAIERGDEIIIPNGNSEIKKGDKILFVADHNNVVSFFKAIGYEYKSLKSYMIIGASRITYYLIDILNKYNSNINIKVFDKDIKICEDLASKYPNVSVINADATEGNILHQEGIDDTDAFITLTGIDEENIILALLANNNGKTKSIAKVNHMNFVYAIRKLDVGSIVNPERVAANLISSYVRAANDSGESNIETLYKLFDGRVEALGFKITSKSKATDVKLKDLNLKSNVIIAGIYRKGAVIRPTGYDELKVGDSVAIITKDNVLNDIVDIVA